MMSDAPFNPKELLWELAKGALVGAAWGALGLTRPRTRSGGFEMVWQFAVAGAIVFAFRYLFSEVSSRSTTAYYLIWMLSTGLAFTAAMVGRIVSSGTGIPGAIMVFAFFAVAGIVFGWMYRKWTA